MAPTFVSNNQKAINDLMRSWSLKAKASTPFRTCSLACHLLRERNVIDVLGRADDAVGSNALYGLSLVDM